MAWPPVLAHSRLTLRGGAGEVDPGHRGALPVRGLRWQPILVERLNAQLAKVSEAGGEAGARDHLVDLERHLAESRRAIGMNLVAVGGSLDPLERNVDDERAPAEKRVLERLHIARAGWRRKARRDRRAHTVR